MGMPMEAPLPGSPDWTPPLPPAPPELTLSPPGIEQDYLVLSWVLDGDGTGCAVVAMPDAVCARTDRLVADGWTVLGLAWIRPEAGGPRIELP